MLNGDGPEQIYSPWLNLPSYPYDFKHDWDSCIEFKVKKLEAGD